MVNNKGLLRSQNCLSITLQVKCKVSANPSLLELCRTVAFTRNCNLYYNCKVTKNNRDMQVFRQEIRLPKKESRVKKCIISCYYRNLFVFLQS
jgi:hypothetical protein